jgi:hypothetical protein
VIAHALGVRLVVLKEFPRSYRGVLSCFLRSGFTRAPSVPLTGLNIAYVSFEDYMQKTLNKRHAGEAAQEVPRGGTRRPDRAQRVERYQRSTHCTCRSTSAQNCTSKS